MSVHHWPLAGGRVLGMHHLHKEESQVLPNMILKGERKFNQVVGQHDSCSGQRWGAELHEPRHAGLRQKGIYIASADLRMEISRVWTQFNPTLFPGLLSSGPKPLWSHT